MFDPECKTCYHSKFANPMQTKPSNLRFQLQHLLHSEGVTANKAQLCPISACYCLRAPQPHAGSSLPDQFTRGRNEVSSTSCSAPPRSRGAHPAGRPTPLRLPCVAADTPLKTPKKRHGRGAPPRARGLAGRPEAARLGQALPPS